ncbi:hypothetical protein VOLCADRAFT_107549 [Volvox carteri f. nagariensis]|uniref:NADH-cytochrome b5 reductase n=1 Tax=Volvox carteri f. nagariensis TaxID=3068 RepID=D8UES1_VOLCA|nr:uncharacterized protein VOLCADRAFT_107549 [Volvox carteri f. nagariensis]EFJ41779.1 hypothetical protein VOLCADRAFT_107549 [Volvox carteri f. nagariensis]|eukprot:XP_002957125.1 hypothetical protein VOLCADRAFT_107549 [Volvox carteri f. nagariensis]
MLAYAARSRRGYSSILAAAALSGTAYAALNIDEKLAVKAVHADAPAGKGALDPNEFRAFKLKEKRQLTRNTFLYRFELPEGQTSGIFVASCLVTRAMLKAKPEDEKPKAVIRPYTPTSPPDAKGYLDLVVKVYDKGVMSKHIDSLKIGDSLEIKGPIKKYPYEANTKKHIGMVAGGTGITPMLQVIDAILDNPNDKTQVSLVYANVSESDIILQDKIDALAAQHPGRFKVYYVVDKPAWGGLFWRGGVGYLTKDMLSKHLPAPAKDSLVMVCGPPGMMEAVSGNKAPDYSQGEVKGLLKELGYDSSSVFKF